MLNKTGFLIEATFKFFFVLYICADVLIVIYPIYEYYFADNLITFLPYMIPGIDPQTFNGYIATMIFQFTGIVLAYFSLIVSDSYFCMIILNMPLMKNLIEIEVNQINDLLGKHSALAIKFKLRNIVLMYKEMKE